MTLDELKRHVRALNNICRFNGHVKRFYSVAEHTAIGLEVMERAGESVRLMRAFAIHDLPEAVLGIGDLSRDVKKDPAIAAIVGPREQAAIYRIACALQGKDCPGFRLIEDVTHYKIKLYDRHMAIAEVEKVALCDHDDPEDYLPGVHGFAARRIHEGGSGDDTARLEPWFKRLFGVEV
jgi:hypothetical protein